MESLARKYKTPLLVATVILFLALAGLYAMGVFDKEIVRQVSDDEYFGGELVYNGGILDGLFSGYGVMNFKNDCSYIGSFSQGRFHGEGLFVHGSGGTDEYWRFEGVFENGKPSSGAFYYDDGSIEAFEDALVAKTWQYIGDLGIGGQNGAGEFTFEDGSVYEGGFTNGLASGKGVYKSPSGAMVYSGSFKDGAFHGTGTYFSPEGWYYEGEFKDGLFDGEGVITRGDATIHGKWERGYQVEWYE